ncbi:MAG: GMP synthase (glutamine-hydrolyzing), partial [Granulosicoccus sp.]
MADLHDQRILILDFGGQTTQLIARRVRECGVYCEIHPWDISDEVVVAFNARGVILSGGPESVIATGAPRIPDAVLNLDVPILGICYGMQAMVHQSGGVVTARSSHSEFGYALVDIISPSPLFDGVQDKIQNDNPQLDVWMSHGDRVELLPKDYTLVGTSDNAPSAIMVNEEQRRYGIQFHPEVTHT